MRLTKFQIRKILKFKDNIKKSGRTDLVIFDNEENCLIISHPLGYYAIVLNLKEIKEEIPELLDIASENSLVIRHFKQIIEQTNSPDYQFINIDLNEVKAFKKEHHNKEKVGTPYTYSYRGKNYAFGYSLFIEISEILKKCNTYIREPNDAICLKSEIGTGILMPVRSKDTSIPYAIYGENGEKL